MFVGDLENDVYAAWHLMPQSHLNALIESMGNHHMNVMEKKGRRIKCSLLKKKLGDFMFLVFCNILILFNLTQKKIHSQSFEIKLYDQFYY